MRHTLLFSFTNADLHSTDLSVALPIIVNAVFNGVNLTNANLTNAKIDGDTNFQGTDLSTANLTNVEWVNGTIVCPDGTHAYQNGDTCIGHLTP